MTIDHRPSPFRPLGLYSIARPTTRGDDPALSYPGPTACWFTTSLEATRGSQGNRYKQDEPPPPRPQRGRMRTGSSSRLLPSGPRIR